MDFTYISGCFLDSSDLDLYQVQHLSVALLRKWLKEYRINPHSYKKLSRQFLLFIFKNKMESLSFSYRMDDRTEMLLCAHYPLIHASHTLPQNTSNDE